MGDENGNNASQSGKQAGSIEYDERIHPTNDASGGATGFESSDTSDTTRRKPGRPKGSRNRESNANPPTQVTVETGDNAAPVKRRRSRTAVKRADAEFTATVLLTMLNAGASNIGGPQAVMNSFEQSVIQPALINVMESGGAVSERVTTLINPLALVLGLSMWGSRVLAERAVYRGEVAHAPATPPPQPQAEPTNGSLPPNVHDMLRTMQR